MTPADETGFILKPDEIVLVTGATGFIGTRVVQRLVDRGVRKIRCFARNSAPAHKLEYLYGLAGAAKLELFRGNLLSQADCIAATQGVAVVIHLAAGRGEKSFPDAFMNSVVTTRNLLEACIQHGSLSRFVNVSSFSVYSNTSKPIRNVLNENCPVESHPEVRGEAYCFAKSRQDEVVMKYGRERGIPYVIVRPGVVYGPGNLAIPGRVGVGTFGLFLHLGGSNPIPFTYVENCADAIALAALKPSIDGEVFNIVDDDLPSSRQFLKLYKRNVRRFRTLYVPKVLSYALCSLWELYSNWSEGQLPPVFNRSRWNSFWRRTRYTNSKLKNLLGWNPTVTTHEGLQRYFEACRAERRHA